MFAPALAGTVWVSRLSDGAAVENAKVEINRGIVKKKKRDRDAKKNRGRTDEHGLTSVAYTQGRNYVVCRVDDDVMVLRFRYDSTRLWNAIG